MIRRRPARRTRGRFPNARFAFVSLSLLGTMLAAAVGAYVLHQSLAEHERSVARSLDEYAMYAGRTFGDQLMRVAGEVRLRVMAPVLGREAPETGPGLALDDFADDAALLLAGAGLGGDPRRGFFRIDLRTGAYRARGYASHAAVAAAIRRSVTDRLPRLAREQEPALGYLYVGPDSTRVTIVWARQMTEGGVAAAILGYSSTRDLGTASLGARVLREVPMVPPAFISPERRVVRGGAHGDTVVSVEMTDVAGNVLFRSPRQFRSSATGMIVFRTPPGGFRVRATLNPRVVDEISRAHQHPDRRRYVVVLPLLSVVLGASAILHLLRERELSRAQRAFVASVSHELRTPLAQIRMFAETLLLRRERGEEQRLRWLGVIIREARRLGDLVDNVLAFSHLEGPGLRLCPEPTEVAALVEDVAATYADFAAGRGVRIEAHAEPGVHALADARALRQVLVNLLDNALKYGPAGQTVRLAASRTADGRVLLAVSDGGPGVPRAERERIWDAFVRLHHEGGSAGGSGLGLAVVRSIVEQQGGRAWVEDAAGGGARFVVVLPAAPAAGAAEPVLLVR